MYLAFLMEVFESEEKFSTDDSNVRFVERAGFELFNISNCLMIELDFIPNPDMNLHPRTP